MLSHLYAGVEMTKEVQGEVRECSAAINIYAATYDIIFSLFVTMMRLSLFFGSLIWFLSNNLTFMTLSYLLSFLNGVDDTYLVWT